MQDKKDAVLTLSYGISQDLFCAYSRLAMNKRYEKKIKRTNFTGVVELAVAIAFSLWVALSEQRNQYVIILCVALLGLGFYSFSYYRFVFPRLVNHSAAEAYKNSAYLQNEIELSFFPSGLSELSQGSENSFKWQQFSRFVELEQMFLLELMDSRTIIIPKREIGDDAYLLREFLQTLSEKYSRSFDNKI